MKIFSIIFIVLFFNNVCYSDYIQDLKRDADSGDPIAQNNYGYTLLYGLHGVEENDELGDKIGIYKKMPGGKKKVILDRK